MNKQQIAGMLFNAYLQFEDITRFEYMQKTNKETGPALVGIELESKNDYSRLLEKMQEYHVDFTEINKDDKLFGYLI